VSYLGHAVSESGLTPQEAKIKAEKEMKAPLNQSELHTVLGFLSYYRCYVPDFSSIAQPLNSLLAGKAAWQWGPDQQQALEALKDEMCRPGKILRHLDPKREILLHTDWSMKGMGAVLGQVDDDGNEYMVACISRSNNKHELNYASYTGELLCVLWAVKTLRPMLHGRKFTVVTDHRPLTWLMTASKDLTGKYARWALALQEHDFDVRYREGAKNQNADALSRMPQESTQDCSGARLDDAHPAAVTGVLLDGGKEVPGRPSLCTGVCAI
jgi:hypothetical protein